MFENIRTVYDEYEIKTKAPVLSVIAVILSIVFLLGAVYILMTGRGIALTVSSIIISACLAVSVVFIRKGKYSISSLFIIYLILAGYSIIRFVVGNSGAHVYAVTGIMLIIMMFIGALFLRTNRASLIFNIIAIIMFALFFIYDLITESVHTEEVNLEKQIFLVILMMPLAVSLSYFFRRIMDSTIMEVRKNFEALGKKEAHMRRLLNESAEQMGRTITLQENSHTTASSSIEIEENVNSIKKRISYLDERFSRSRSSLANITDSIIQLKNLSDDQAANVEESSASIEQMVSSIQSVSLIID